MLDSLATILNIDIPHATIASLSSLGISSLSDLVQYTPDGVWEFNPFAHTLLPSLHSKSPADIPNLIPVSMLRPGTCWSTTGTELPYPNGVFEILGIGEGNKIITRIWTPSTLCVGKKKAPSSNLALHPDSSALGSATLTLFDYDTLFPRKDCTRVLLSADITTAGGPERKLLSSCNHTRPL
jgi:hypothetical protein